MRASATEVIAPTTINATSTSIATATVDITSGNANVTTPASTFDTATTIDTQHCRGGGEDDDRQGGSKNSKGKGR